MAECMKIKVLGEGSFGTVYLAVIVSPPSKYDKPIAIKSSKIEKAYSLQREGSILRSFIGCREIIQYIWSARTIDNGFHLLMEYAPYGSLGDLIKKGTLLENEVRVFTRMLLRGLCYIHQLGVIHCDLKPDNILLFPSSEIGVRFQLKIADFGLSRIRGEIFANDYDDAGRKKIKFRATPFYMSPESVVGLVDTPLDIWSLGCIVIQMISGVPPWKSKGLTRKDLLIKLGLQKEIPDIPPFISHLCRDFLRKCFVTDPRYRWTAHMLLHHPFLLT